VETAVTLKFLSQQINQTLLEDGLKRAFTVSSEETGTNDSL
jgi:hypothetical protein